MIDLDSLGGASEKFYLRLSLWFLVQEGFPRSA